MKFSYYADTDSLYIDLSNNPGSDTREMAPDGSGLRLRLPPCRY